MKATRKEKLLESTDMALKCSSWWKREVAKIIEESAEIFEKLDSNELEWHERESLEDEAEELLKKMDHLVARGNIEDNIMVNLIKEVHEFYEGNKQ